MGQFQFTDKEKAFAEAALRNGDQSLQAARNDVLKKFGDVDEDGYVRMCKIFAIAHVVAEFNHIASTLSLVLPSDGPANRRWIRLSFEVRNLNAAQVMYTRRCTQCLAEMLSLSDYYFTGTDKVSEKCYLTHTFEIWLYGKKPH